MKQTVWLLALLLALGCCACSASEAAPSRKDTAGENEVSSPAGDVSQSDTGQTPPESGEEAAGDGAATGTGPDATGEETAGTAPASGTGDPGALARVMEIVLAKAKATRSWDFCNRAALVDLNGDGSDELLVSYETVAGMEQRVEVWTDEDGRPRLLWENELYDAAGGPKGGVKWMEMNGVTYLCIYESNYNGRGIGDNGCFTGSLDCFSPGYWTEQGLYMQLWLSYDFYGPDNRTPDPDPGERESRLIEAGQHCTVEEFQEWMAAFDRSQDILLHVGDENAVGMTLEETARVLGVELPAGWD